MAESPCNGSRPKVNGSTTMIVIVMVMPGSAPPTTPISVPTNSGSRYLTCRMLTIPAEQTRQKLNYPLVAISFGVFALYCVALPNLGFRISTFAYVAAASALLAPPRGPKAWAGRLLLAFATAFLTWLVFERYLSVLLPRGRWTQF